MPQPLSPTGQFVCVYDAWNRMTQVVIDADADGVADAGETVAGEYEYDGLSRRVRKHVPVGNEAAHHDHFYYNTSWQILEIRRVCDGTGYVPKTRLPLYQYVWSQRYIGDVMASDANRYCA
jgi:hypothetical protein